MSVAKAEAAIDGWVDRFDPAALRRTEVGSRDRHLDVIPKGDGSGLAYVEGTLYADDAAALNQRVGQLARGVCENDPRTIDQRRADALGAVAAGADQLGCACGDPSAPRLTVQRRVQRWCMSLPRSAVWPMTRRCSSTARNWRGRGCLSRCGR